MSKGIQISSRNGTPIARFGEFPDGSVALKIAKSGFDVRTATPSQLIFNSNQDIFKIAINNTYTIPQQVLGASTEVFDTVVLPHNLPQIPALLAYGQFPIQYGLASSSFVNINAYLSLPFVQNQNYSTTGFIGGNNILFQIVSAFVDATNLYITYNYETTSGGGFTFPAVTVRYYLLQETATWYFIYQHKFIFT